VLRDVVRLDPEELGDRGVRLRPRIPGVGPGEVDQDRPRGRRPRIAAGGPVGPDDVAAQVASPGSVGAGAAAGAGGTGGTTGSSAPAALPAEEPERPPRRRRQTAWSGS